MKLLVLAVMISKTIAQFSAQSPCPSVFSYEETEPNQNHWFGIIYLTTKTSLVGVRLDIRFDRPVILLVSWMGEVTSKSSRKFTILSLSEKLLPGPPLESRFMVKYDRRNGMPELTTIRLNGQKICPPDPEFAVDPLPNTEEIILDRPTRRPVIDSSRPYYQGSSHERTTTEYSPTYTHRYNNNSYNHMPPHKHHNSIHVSSGHRQTPNNSSNSNNNSGNKHSQGSTHTILHHVSTSNNSSTTHHSSGSSNSNNKQTKPPSTEYSSSNSNRRTSTVRSTTREANVKRTTSSEPYMSNFPNNSSNQNHKIQTEESKPWQLETTRSYVTRSTTPSYNKLPSECGLVDDQVAQYLQSAPVPLITNGRQTAQGQWPWHIALYRTSGPESNYICGGTLISDLVVVTAAHCVYNKFDGRPVDPNSLIVYLGKYHLAQWSDDSGVQNKQVREMKVHPEYSTVNYAADIALLMLTSAASYTPVVRPCCLWRSPLQSVEGKTGTVVGWGFDENKQVSSELKMAEMPVVSRATCIESYRDFFERYASNKTYCAGSRTGVSACNGDSGGGMVFSLGSRWYLRGIVSIAVPRDNKICDPDHYIIFTDIAKYIDWINDNMD